ncbi:MAG: hypothetical protein HYU99_00335 [Deltaproteobacteria bacterium]|nr:hypothetical protein [Deltaproteobacteria bacterium]
MKGRFYIRPLLFFALIGGFLACTEQKGVEAGNPDLTDTKVRTVTSDSTEVYYATIEDEDTLSIEQISVSADGQTSETLETVTTSYTQSESTLTYSAAFTNHKTIEVSVTIDDETDTVTTGSLTLNGETNSATFDFEPTLNRCRRATDHAARQLLEAGVDRLVGCFPHKTCSNIGDGLADVINLSEEFGGPADTSMTNVIAMVDDGSLIANETNLTTCLAALGEITCADFVGVFDPALVPPDFSQIHTLVPAESCSEVF